ncbi:hypothetical protein IFM61392_07923 [Aspergillus lentulus]|uniref:ribonuclease T1 n=1 Tax=Aspergillus lentulus TaxID=293939 RepID=A0ABQ1AIU3_ASPLE|nr:hypothetical protein IFM62136_07408 [Aspergillus lentulus]GFF82703.1 hypothetical protein IFM60648_06443 [Aspergillus lentulus]GFF91571.1 hypothetical protein IFM47457_08886 [Aspergillus lentulus]GFG13423.1 hypothetical protein IFM61392_07923 [Aspergillus lentulus]
MYFSTAILASAALGGLNVYATPLPSTNESFTRTLIVSLSVRAQTVSVEQARVFQAAQSYDLTEGGGVIGRNGEFELHTIALRLIVPTILSFFFLVIRAEYPHEFRNTPENLNFPDCAGVPAPYQEFPILANGRIFGSVGNDDPLTDRIVYKITIHSPVTGFPDNFAFCGVMTHLGATQNQFVLCKDI